MQLLVFYTGKKGEKERKKSFIFESNQLTNYPIIRRKKKESLVYNNVHRLADDRESENRNDDNNCQSVWTEGLKTSHAEFLQEGDHSIKFHV